ncbi:transposase [uncultured Maricaulis sp.]|uniref:transposase n=1 Tax=uncultured Maricaulis sp. TaxID=174710 RepID=UPI0030D8B9A8|tara:strand:+ start:97855 stop:98532 length:678 start_codon:yes stop_codon:yes gene_type:complete
MPRTARLVLPGCPHHITQRGNRRQRVFFCHEDYALYRHLLGVACRKHGVACWAFCLMPNHVHLVLVPQDETGLAAALHQTHLCYTQRINPREGWSGFLWQGRYFSCPLDEGHALAALRYVELNPVRAGLCEQPQDWPWSSTRHRLRLKRFRLLAEPAFLRRIPDWGRFLAQGLDAATQARIGLFTRTGHPLGAEDWVATLERQAGRSLRPRPRGRPAGAKGDRYN